MLSREQVEFFHSNGYLVVPKLKSVQACDRLRDRMAQLLDDFDPGQHRVVFSTQKERDEKRDAYFMDSGDKIRFFFEEDAFDDCGELRQPKQLSINKVGHALHDLDPVFDAFSRDPRLAEISRDLGQSKAHLIQSMYIFKQPRIGGFVRPHQDSSYLFSQPESTIGYWFALEPATLENGCLWALPGAHRGPLECRYRRRPDGSAVLENLHEVDWPEQGWVPLEVDQGSLVVLHGYLPHKSKANRSGRSRHAYAVHTVDASAKWSHENWLQRPGLPFRGF